MKAGQTLWTREELILVLALYYKTEFRKMHSRNPDVVKLANLIGRTTGSIAYKLVNFASLDPSLQARGIKGAINSSNLDKAVWSEFFGNWDELPYKSEKLLARIKNSTVEALIGIPEGDLFKEGRTREQLVRVRVDQSFFRKTILASYNNTCCITGIQQPEFLIAGHIKPWGIDEKNRLNPQNGIAVNALHDKAFEAGLLTITPDYIVKISPLVLNQKNQHTLDFFTRYEDKGIILPSKFLPSKEFLDYHNQERFKS